MENRLRADRDGWIEESWMILDRVERDKDDDDSDEDKADDSLVDEEGHDYKIGDESTQFDLGDLLGPDKQSKSVIPHRFYENGMKTYFDQFGTDTNKKTREMRQPARVVVGVVEQIHAPRVAGEAKVYPWVDSGTMGATKRAGEFDPLASAMVGVVEWRILEVVWVLPMVDMESGGQISILGHGVHGSGHRIRMAEGFKGLEQDKDSTRITGQKSRGYRIK
ncbi:hypothetical protein PPACK8108_LOCUS24633 [Phakopsora pachyrhizi]|uniref:Uncharacterized protein n=1 Tax=Phakopsora pachyrhizi TaxID=170000 RepID=A0AAV0BS84_PHAPC|nr:hypothetical protein PPACK8108_LOCUS24633 [Phakopsora pachyrhizi]